MNFVSWKFWGVLVLLLAPYLLLRRAFPSLFGNSKSDRIALAAISLLLFALEDALSFVIFLGICVIALTSLQWIPKTRNKWLWTITVSFVLVTPLLFFKYGLAQSWFPTEMNYLIPIGLSFYTFQIISLLVDSNKGKHEPEGVLDLINYASFFPQIVAGPIERKSSLLPQLKNFTFRFTRENTLLGVHYILLGLTYKLVVADNLANNSLWIQGAIKNPWLIHLSNVIFGIRIYFDFCGYSLIALGIGRLLGISLTVNFLSPYSQRNLQDFWRCWHISLSNWFRDYIYIPLGGNRVKFQGALILLVFGVSGIWHGSGFGFLLWGLMHGAGMVFLLKMKGRIKLPALLSHTITIAFVMTAWLFFYQTDTSALTQKISSLFNMQGYVQNPVNELLRLSGGYSNLLTLMVATGLGICVIGIEWWSYRKRKDPYHWGQYYGVQLAMIIAMVLLSPTANNGFIYFNF